MQQSAQSSRHVSIFTGSQNAVPHHTSSWNSTYEVQRACHEGSTFILPGVRRHLRGRRGGLKDMPEMPLDILFEVRSCIMRA